MNPRLKALAATIAAEHRTRLGYSVVTADLVRRPRLNPTADLQSCHSALTQDRSRTELLAGDVSPRCLFESSVGVAAFVVAS